MEQNNKINRRYTTLAFTAACTALIETVIVFFTGFLHSTTAITAFLGIMLFLGWIFKESREDLPQRTNWLLSGFIAGTFIAMIFLSYLCITTLSWSDQ